MKNFYGKNDLARFLFHEGTNYNLFDYLGAHPCKKDSETGFVFRVWAPRAEKVCLVGDFNGWLPDVTPLQRLSDGEIAV